MLKTIIKENSRRLKMNKLIKINLLTYEMLVKLSQKPQIKPELFLEALIHKYYAEKKYK